jgi:DNA-binding SARP family transcriptional activator/tetratricopeptide (TPR) repeat protein
VRFESFDRGAVVDIRLLGPVEVWAADVGLDMGPPQQRAVLAALAVDAGRPVFRDTLLDRIWSGRAPDGAASALYAHINRIRRALAAGTAATAGATGTEHVRLARRSGGYVLEVDPQEVDLHRFRRLALAARDRQRPDDERAGMLREALDLWRGEPLADLPGEWPARMRDSWEEERLDAAVAWAQAELRLGRPDEVIGPVRDLAARHPLSERPVGVLMQALAAEGRDAEALECYAIARSRLVEALGAEPGRELQAVHLAILKGERPAAQADDAAVSRPAPLPVPAQLPPDVRGFTGRQDELDELDRLLIDADDQSTAVVISAVAGTAGVGKTALAVRWAHRVRDKFPDGQLYVDLRGYGPDRPVAPEKALARFLANLGVAGQDIPLDVDDRAARYRTEINGRRMLVVLDNAASVEQIRQLLPGTRSCSVVVTSRDSLPGLVAVHGGRRLDLGLLPHQDAVALLRTLIGDRVKAEPGAAATLATQCARLPLALRVTAELATARPATPLAGLVRELADESQRLQRLDAGGDPRAAVRVVFSWSYKHLPAGAARAFRLAGLHPGSDLDPYATAALTGTQVDEARRALDILERAHLVHLTGPERYGTHDLLRAYARDLAHSHDSDADRRAALTRLFDYYLAAAGSARDARTSPERRQGPSSSPDSFTPPMAGPAAALAWLDAERPNLVAIAAYTAAHGWPGHTIWLSTTLFRYLDAGAHFHDAVSIHTDAKNAARQTGDPAAEAYASANLGVVHMRQGHYEQAAEHYLQALLLFSQTGDRVGEARTLTHLGLVNWRQGRYQQAAERHGQALARCRQTGNLVGEANALSNLGLVLWRQGRYEEALEDHRQALILYRETGYRYGEGNALANLGVIHLTRGRYERAADDLRQALVTFSETGNRIGEGYALANLGLVNLGQGRNEQAADDLGQAVTIFRETGNRDGEAEALNGVGEVLHAAGLPDQARTQHAAALTLAVETGDRYQQARAHSGIADARHEAGEDALAREHWQHALTLYNDLGVPDGELVRVHLAALGRMPETGGSA